MDSQAHSHTSILPTTPFGPDWQNYFEVTNLTLPNIAGPIARSFAGNVGVNRADHPNATLFFWAFEKANGTLTGSAADTDPWIIWLDGGPGSSSMSGLLTENGPLQVVGSSSIVQNNFSWHKLADTMWIDQPVGTGYSTSDADGYVPDEDQLGQDFVEFLSNIVKIFPSLAKRPLHLSGESYAGKYIPYITKTIFSTPNPPVNLAKMIVGDGTLGSVAAFEMVPTLTTIETYPQLIGYDPDVYNYFKTQYAKSLNADDFWISLVLCREHLCGYDLNLTYPQNGHFPTLRDPSFGSSIHTSRPVFKTLAASHGRLSQAFGSDKREFVRREEHRQSWKRSLAGRPNGTLDPFYGCYIYDELLDYANNFSFPWTSPVPFIDIHDIPDARDPAPPPNDPTVFMNNKDTRAALHAPTSKDWSQVFDFPFGGTEDGSSMDPSTICDCLVGHFASRWRTVENHHLHISATWDFFWEFDEPGPRAGDLSGLRASSSLAFLPNFHLTPHTIWMSLHFSPPLLRRIQTRSDNTEEDITDFPWEKHMQLAVTATQANQAGLRAMNK
ncbi:Alpha/Beta hydrolase protein [Mycena epipterygia]|nr:Alpha/Beta hydrolase protein [Mycena epipterygia]